MSVNGITGTSDLYSAYSAQSPAAATKPSAEAVSDQTASEGSVAAVYEKSDRTRDAFTTYSKPDVVARMKADAESRMAQMQSLVEKLIMKQSGTSDMANDIWNMLRTGKVEVDPQTRAEAQEAISEDGYWGVKQTSQRIFDFAVALAGDDPEKLGKMRDAFLEGFKKAEQMWGGELPEISQQTYGAVLEKFDRAINGDVTETQA